MKGLHIGDNIPDHDLDPPDDDEIFDKDPDDDHDNTD
jgi:hypothetical protein